MPKKFRRPLIVLAIVVLGIVWFIIKRTSAQEINIHSEQANWSYDQNRQLQQKLVNISGKYLQAATATNAVFFTDIESASYQEWQQRLDQAIKTWEELEVQEKAMDSLLDEMGIPDLKEEDKIKELSSLYQKCSSFYSNLKPKGQVAGAKTEKGSAIPELGAVTAVFDSASAGYRLRKVMEVFGWDKKTAYYHLKREQGLLEADAWNKAGDTYQRWETAARTIKDTSKVTVFVLGNIITAGGASATVGALQGTAVVFGGTSLAIEIGEDVHIAFGDEDGAATLHTTGKVLKVPTEIINVLTLNYDSLGDPGNIVYLIDKTGEMINLGRDIYFDLTSKGKIKVSESPSKKVKKPKTPSEKEAKTAGLPKGKYRIDGEVVETKGSEVETAKPTSVSNLDKFIPSVNDVISMMNTLASYNPPPGLKMEADNTYIDSGNTNTINFTIPGGYTGPFKVKNSNSGGSGATLGLPSTIDGTSFTGEFISSKGGIFSPTVELIDANGNTFSATATIQVAQPIELTEEETKTGWTKGECGNNCNSEEYCGNKCWAICDNSANCLSYCIKNHKQGSCSDCGNCVEGCYAAYCTAEGCDACGWTFEECRAYCRNDYCQHCLDCNDEAVESKCRANCSGAEADKSDCMSSCHSSCTQDMTSD